MKALPLAFACALFAAWPATAQDTRAIQIREAQRTDERTFAYFGQFRSALTARFGADPLLSMFAFDEQEGQALVHKTPDAPAEHVIYQTGKWISTDGRQLKPWAPDADPALTRFRLSAIGESLLREKFRAYRTQPAKAADHLGGVKIGYFGAPFNRLIVEVSTVSMASSFAMSVWGFDLKSGQPLDLMGAIADMRTQRQAAQAKESAAEKVASQRNLRNEIPAVLAAFRREVGPAKLMGVWITREDITFIQADRTKYEYSRRGTFTRMKSPYDSELLCTDGFDDREIDWNGFAPLVEKAMLAGNLDEEDRDHADIHVERPHACAPLRIQIIFSNYQSPQPYSLFDARGRLMQ